MKKIALLLVAVFTFAQGLPISESDITNAAAEGNWDLVHKLIRDRFNSKNIWEPSLGAGSVRSLKPAEGGHVYGEAEYAFHESSNVNGKKMEKSGGHKVINDNGKVSEFDFDPKF